MYIITLAGKAGHEAVKNGTVEDKAIIITISYNKEMLMPHFRNIQI